MASLLDTFVASACKTSIVGLNEEHSAVLKQMKPVVKDALFEKEIEDIFQFESQTGEDRLGELLLKLNKGAIRGLLLKLVESALKEISEEDILNLAVKLYGIWQQ